MEGKCEFYLSCRCSPTFPTNIVSRREEDWSEPQDELTKESSFCVLEDLDAFQGVQVDVNRDFGFQFVWKKNRVLSNAFDKVIRELFSAYESLSSTIDCSISVNQFQIVQFFKRERAPRSRKQRAVKGQGDF